MPPFSRKILLTLQGDMQRRRLLVAAAAVAVAAVIAVAWSFDPMEGTFPYPRCTFKWLTGWDCPGCGATRALHALLHGRVGDAWAANPAVFVAVPLIALAFAAERPRNARLRRMLLSPVVISVLLAATILWTIVRNL